jgi:hypothetical protein
MTKEQTLRALENQMDSFYSLDQVIKIIGGIEEVNINNVTEDDIVECISKLLNRLDGGYIDIIDKDDIEFSIGYSNQIELDRVGILTNDLNDELHEIFMPLCSKGTDDYKYL